MEISSDNQVTRIYQMNSATAVVSTNSSVPSNNKTTTDRVTISDTALNAERKLQEIANQYEPTNMSYSELIHMSSELQSNGLITPQEGLAMRAPPSRYFDPSEKYNTVALARKSVEFDQSLGSAQGKDAKIRASVLDVLETLQKSSGKTNHAK